MAHRKRWTRLIPGVALAATAALAAAGCTSSAPAGSAGASAAGGVTTAQAAAAYSASLAVSRTDLGQLSDGTGAFAQWARSSYLTARHFHISPSPSYIRYGAPVFYLPESTGYPQWFIADVHSTYTGPKPAQGTRYVGGPGGIQWPDTDGQLLMFFTKASAAAPWKIASSARIAPGMALPALAGDGHGHVPTVPLSDDTLLARPDTTGPLQAAVVDDGPASPATRVVAGGELTTGIYARARAGLLGLTAPRGDVLESELEGSPYPQVALRTADGGALVFYAMYLNTIVQTPGSLAQARPLVPGPPITVPPNLTPLLPRGQAAPRVKLEGQQLLSFVAVDPPAGKGKIQVIAIEGDYIYASAS